MMILQIPYAYVGDTFECTTPTNAQKGQNYRCPECGDDVILRRGEMRVPHFAHKADTPCTNEGVLHKVAKHILYSIFYTSFRRLKKPVVGLRRKCPVCDLVAYQKPPDWFSERAVVATEFTIKDLPIDGKDRRVDVFVGEKNDDGTIAPGLAIEIQSAHPVPQEKWDALKARGIPCVEVSAQSIIDEWDRERFTNLTDPWFLLNPIKQNIYIPGNPDDEGVIGSRLPHIDCLNCKTSFAGEFDK